MRVVKRDSSIVDFNSTKIEKAIEKAWKEVEPTVDYNLLKTVVREVVKDLSDLPEVSVEMIQDKVELALMKELPLVAKRYIIYREERKTKRDNKPKYKFLSNEFLSKYKHKESPLNQIGNFVFYRTYSRYLPEENRREFWWETLARAVDYNMSLSPHSTRAEAEELYDNIYNLKQQLSGEIRPLY